MKKLNNIYQLLIFSILLLGCNEKIQITKKLILDNPELKIEISLGTIEYKIIDESEHTFLKGQIRLLNKSNDVVKYNINNVYLVLNNVYGKIYIDSIASHLITEKELSRNSEFVEDVYWAFDFKLVLEDLDNLQIIYKVKG